MAVRLSKNIQESSRTGFNLIFSQNTTYDLDEIVANRNRKASNRKLLIEVKNDQVISQKIMDKLLEDIDIKINSELGTEDIKEKVNNIIQMAYAAYPTVLNSDITNKNVLGFINFNVNKLASEKFEFSVKYSVEITDYSNLTISYEIDSDDLNALFIEYYNKYATEFQAELESVDEGGLAISSEKKTKINPTYLDYQKYLLDEERKTVKSTGTSNYRTVIEWNDYSQDERDQEDVIEVPLEYLENYVSKKELEEILKELKNN